MAISNARTIRDVAQQLGVNRRLIYYWIDCGLVNAVRIPNPYLARRQLTRISYYEYVNKYDQVYYGRARVKAIPEDEFQWLLFIHNNMPELLNKGSTPLLRIIKRVSFPITKEHLHD